MFINKINVTLIEQLISQLKRNSSAGNDNLVAENIIYSHPALIVHLKLLYSLIIIHGYVPNDFGIGTIVPVPKETINAKNNCTSNYRPITIIPIIAKLFEMLLLELVPELKMFSNLQYGFKEGLGCRNALFLLSKITDHFNSRGSNIYIASMDASKAFDRVNHYELFSAMYDRGISNVFISIISNWYLKLRATVRWSNEYSSIFNIPT